MNFDITSVLPLLFLIPSITFHEFMHGWAAYQLGDPTAKNAGRLTLNPIKSIDPFGSILLPLIGFLAGGFIFGYAKPVPYNPMYFKNLRQGEIIVGFAGPSANLALALVGAAIAWAAVPVLGANEGLAKALYVVGYSLAEINLVLMFFNLIPIPPLDGSSIVPIFLPDSMLRGWYGIQRYAFGILIVLLIGIPYLGSLVGMPGLNPIGWYLEHTALAVLNLLMPR
ncbi:MAG: site-2 protease family protein [Coriobacteriia bacterium]|nr:site-2 protease family protein [Coriobacteriia bacterium]